LEGGDAAGSRWHLSANYAVEINEELYATADTFKAGAALSHVYLETLSVAACQIAKHVRGSGMLCVEPRIKIRIIFETLFKFANQSDLIRTDLAPKHMSFERFSIRLPQIIQQISRRRIRQHCLVVIHSLPDTVQERRELRSEPSN
jgi:hypothetical protein